MIILNKHKKILPRNSLLPIFFLKFCFTSFGVYCKKTNISHANSFFNSSLYCSSVIALFLILITSLCCEFANGSREFCLLVFDISLSYFYECMSFIENTIFMFLCLWECPKLGKAGDLLKTPTRVTDFVTFHFINNRFFKCNYGFKIS